METLIKLYEFESVHGTKDETAIADFVEKFLEEYGRTFTRVGNSLFSLDSPEAPIFSAHLDQVKTNGKAEHFVLTPEGYIQGYTKNWQRTSLGADDKNGVWLILKLIESGADINFIISEGEEVGCVGISQLESLGHLKAITTDMFCIVLDRRGNDEILKSGAGTTFCSTLAQDLCNFLGGYKTASGSVSDTVTLCKYCESVNMSVAYHEPHTGKEYTDWERLQEILDDLKLVVDMFVHYSTPPSVYRSSVTPYYSSRSSGRSSLYDWRDGYDY